MATVKMNLNACNHINLEIKNGVVMKTVYLTMDELLAPEDDDGAFDSILYNVKVFCQKSGVVDKAQIKSLVEAKTFETLAVQTIK